MTPQHPALTPATPTALLGASEVLGALRVKYSELKAEQRSRIGTRDNLVYATLAAIGLVVASGGLMQPTPAMLLVLPMVTTVLGWTRVQNDLKISAIGWHIRTKVEPRINALLGRTVMDWESCHNGPGTSRLLRKICQLVADLILFAVPPVAALVAFWATGPLAWHWFAVSIVEAVTVAGLIYMIVAHSGIRPQGRDSEQETP